jgi:UDPglucose 6-dehydrogenase
MNICVQGLWHLGSVTSACLASKGLNVAGIDPDQNVIQKLSMGYAPIFEPGLDDLIKKGINSKNLTFYKNLSDIATPVDFLWVTFDTPVDDDDVADVDYIFNQIVSTFHYLSYDAIVLISSQLPVGSVARLENIAAERFGYLCIQFAYSPENLRLGKALDVFLNPDRIVVGVRNQNTRDRIKTVLSCITDSIECMTVESAEMTKHAINAFLASSVVFANEIATFCEHVGANAQDVARGLKSESRIGPKAYLSPGGAFAGGTLARDVKFLGSIANEFKFSAHLLHAIASSNEIHKRWSQRQLSKNFISLNNLNVLIWGLTYKPGTNTLRRSLAIELCYWLIEQNANIYVHDPVVTELPLPLRDKITISDSPSQFLDNADVLVLATEWPEYKDIELDNFIDTRNKILILDANGFLKLKSKCNYIKYISVGGTSEFKL